MPIFHSDDYMDYLSIDGLTKASGVESEYHIKLAIKELVDNALDVGKCEIGMLENNGFYIQDDGPGINGTDEEIAYLFSINRKTYSTKGDRYPRRGAMGRGLRFVMGVVYCYKAIMTLGTKGRILKLTPQREGTNYETIGKYEQAGTRIEIIFPESTEIKKDILEWGQLAIELSAGESYNGPSSPHWYDEQSFYVFLNSIETNGEKTINILKTIFGIKRELKYREFDEKLRKLLKSPSSKNFSEEDALAILERLREVTKEISPKKLKLVGELKDFDFYSHSDGSFQYSLKGSKIQAKIPYVIEIWARQANFNESSGGVRFFVNKTPIPIKSITILSFEKNWVISESSIGIYFECEKINGKFVIYINITTPFLPMTGNAKLPKIPKKMAKDTEIMFQKLVKKINRKIKSTKKHEIDKNDPNIAPKIQEIIHPQKKLLDKYFKLENLHISEETPLLVLRNDPFYLTNRKTAVEKAIWFKSIWERLNPEGKLIHLRRLHYQIVSQPENNRIETHDKRVYMNEEKFWNYLIESSKYARELELIDPLLIVDMRNPDPYGTFIERLDILGNIKPFRLNLPEIDTLFIEKIKMELPELEFDRKTIFNFFGALHPVHLEIWTEKATMNDILTEICAKYGILLVQNTGYSSITGIERFLKERAFRTDRPSVIFYISDYDEAGENMPIMVSRTIQHRVALEKGRGNLHDKEIAVYPIILTKEQMQQEEFKGLPKNPAKIGQGTVTELDALEAVRPGLFKSIVEEKLNMFLDHLLKEKVEVTLQRLKDEFNAHIRKQLSLREIEEIENKLKEISIKFQPIIIKISDDIESEVKPFKEKLANMQKEVDQLSHKISEELIKDFQKMIGVKNRSFSFEDALFLSTRTYLEQTERLISYRSFSSDKTKKEPKKIRSINL